MLSRWWSWQLVLPVAALVTLFSVMHFFFAPLMPSFIHDSSNAPKLARIGGNSYSSTTLACEVGGGSASSPPVFRNATWRAEIGSWLSRCDQSANPVPVAERIWMHSCKLGCSGHGVCNQELGQCQCFVGFSGASCEVAVKRECNRDATQEWPYGQWGVSICPGYCEPSTARCYCGNNTKYPHRPLAEACGFRIKEDNVTINWTAADDANTYGVAGGYKGWCNLDKEDVYEKKMPIKQPQCDCKYDGQAGAICEFNTESFCINQCTDNGICQHGFCVCNEGWYGIDCSVPSSLPPVRKWPNWLLPAAINLSLDNAKESTGVKITVVKKRPFIYVYDLPVEYTSQLLQGRHFKYHCVNRLYDGDNNTLWINQLYGAEVAMYESLLASEHRTTNGDEADFFYVPVLQACIVFQADDAPHMNMQGHFMGLRQYYAGDFSRRAYLHIRENYPYWNRTEGRDHIWFFPWDEGACTAPKEIWNSMMLTHWGNTNSKYKTSTTAYFSDSWKNIPSDWRGDHPCYDPEKDLVLPAWKHPDPSVVLENLVARPRYERPTLFYFNGNLGNAYQNGRLEAEYSMGIRQRLAAEFGSQPDKNGTRGRQAADDVVVTGQRSPNYQLELSKSRFCGVLPGDGWSGRLEDSIIQGCIPVIIQDGIHLPFESVLDFEMLAVRIAEDDLPNLITILRAINDTQVDAKLAAVQGAWQRFTYHHAIKLEAKRQKSKYNSEYPWATAYNSLTLDDAYSTFIQVLHYKLHNDDWRRDQKLLKRDYGVPGRCR